MLAILFSFLFLISKSYAGIYEPNVLWDKKEIGVCFYDHPEQFRQTSLVSPEGAKSILNIHSVELFNSEEERKIQMTLSQNYKPDLTGIHFKGFQKCSETKEFDVILFKGVSPFVFKRGRLGGVLFGSSTMGDAGVESVGEGFIHKGYKRKAFVMLSQVNKGVIVHEFGHIAGLRHEDIHEEGLNDRRCHDAKRVFNIDKREWINPTTKVFTEYDPTSVMNYCHFLFHYLKFENEEVLLSSKDIETLRFLYL